MVELPQLGTLQGSVAESAWTKRTIYQFLGFKYAESPSGTKRFKVCSIENPNKYELNINNFKLKQPPVATGAWKGVKYANKYARHCPILSEIIRLSDEERKADLEDCLTLDIYTTEVNCFFYFLFFFLNFVYSQTNYCLFLLWLNFFLSLRFQKCRKNLSWYTSMGEAFI